MFDLHPAVLSAFVGLTGVVLLVFAWRSVSSLPGLARWSLRLVLAAIIVVPFALLVLTPRNETARAPMERDVATSEAAAPNQEATSARPAEVQKDVSEGFGKTTSEDLAAERKLNEERSRAARRESTSRGTLEDTLKDNGAGTSDGSAPADSSISQNGGNGSPAAPPPSAPGAMPDVAAPASQGPTRGLGQSGSGEGGGGAGLGRIGAGGASPPPAANGQSASDVRGMRGTGGMSGMSGMSGMAPSPVEVDRSAEVAPSAGAAGEEKEDWTVVPVYYGTDRARAPNDKRVDYGSDRGRRLELGRAMVSVPKIHEVPQIERPWAITIPYFNIKIYEKGEDPKKHFIIQEIAAMPEAQLMALVKERLAKSARFKDHAFVFVHGYNTSFDFAIYRAAQIANDIKFDGAPFVYSWPSGGGIASYTYDRESSAQAEPYFTEFLKMVTQKSGAKHVSVIAHSMGNQLLLRVLQELERTLAEGVEISQVIFAAPDVDRDSFESIASSLKDFATGGITLYAASNDRALSVSKRFYGGVPRAGDVPSGGPLIMPGIDTIDATAVSMDALGLHHSGYAESNALLQDIGLLIQTGERPPGKRVPILQQVTTAKGDYWRYPGSP